MNWLIIIILLLLVLLAYSVIFLGSPTIWDVIDVVISLTAITGLFAFAYKKQIATPKFWFIMLITIIVWDIIYNVLLAEYLDVAQQISQDIETNLVDIILGYLLIIPEYIALYLLAYKSEALWKK